MKKQLSYCVTLCVALIVSLNTHAAVNPIDYFKNTSPYKTFHAKQDGHSYGFVSYYENSSSPDGRFRIWYTKLDGSGNKFERYGMYDNFIALERDTSWPAADGGGNDAYDAYPYGNLRWAKMTGQNTGERIISSATIAGYNHIERSGSLGCVYNDATPFTYSASYDKKLTYIGHKDWGGEIGSAETIRISHLEEAHYYAKGFGWIAWKAPNKADDETGWIVWNRGRDEAGRIYPQILPKDNCGLMGNWPVNFRDTSTTRDKGVDWDYLYGKATCANNEGISAISRNMNDKYATRAVCKRGAIYTGERRAILTADAGSDQRRHSRAGDWSLGNYKLECGLNEYVAGVSQNVMQHHGNNRFHNVLCARSTVNLDKSCSYLAFGNTDSRNGVKVTSVVNGVTVTREVTGDWDAGTPKNECGLNQTLVGVSINPVTAQPQGLLCCGY